MQERLQLIQSIQTLENDIQDQLGTVMNSDEFKNLDKDEKG